MIPVRLLPHAVTVLTPTTVLDGYGDPVVTFAPSAATPVIGWMQQQGEKHNTDGVDSKAGQWVFFSNDEVVAFHDRLVWRGRTFEVTAEPHRVETPLGPHHVEAYCQEVKVV